ncbi:MAG: cytochrome c oxidase assembly protein [Acidimicrobiales bacterium]|nr:cytochrome c oxidase assembly protein [Acidimicrobiales bacterium]
MTAAVNPWAFVPHPEVWALIAAVIGLGYFATRIIGPKVVPAGTPVVTTKQRRAYWVAVIVLWLASDWPMHDIAEQYLYSVHMVQHLLITFVVPPLILYAMPEWLARLIVFEGGWSSRLLQKLTHPVVAGAIFNALAALTHWAVVVNTSADNGPFHYAIHLALFMSALLMWMPVIGPLPELRLGPLGQAVYLFIMSIIPTVPAAWLTFATGTVYSAYDILERPWGISVAADQQSAGAIMKVFGGLYLWCWIAAVYFRHANRLTNQDRAVRRYADRFDAKAAAGVDDEEPLTYEKVTEAFSSTADS